MSGILGLWNLDGQPVAAELLGKMSATLAHRGPDGEGQWIDGPVGLGSQLMRVTPESLTETQPLVGPSGAVVVFDGRLDNREELLSLLRGAPGIAPDSPDPALVLAAYDRWGERFPEYLNGDFALGTYDPCRRQLLLARDAIGLRPLYYYRTGDIFLFGSEIKALLAHPQVAPTPNDEFISRYLLGGLNVMPQDSTCFQGISTVPPGHLVAFKGNQPRLRPYWNFNPLDNLHFKSFEECAEAFRELFAQAVRRRLRSAYPIAFAVSGGLDSSSIFCMSQTFRKINPGKYPPFHGIAFTSRDGSLADESAMQDEIEHQYAVTIQRLPIIAGFMTGAAKSIWYGELPRVDGQWDTLQPLRQTARELGARVLLEGDGADQVLFNPAYMVDILRDGKVKEVISHLQGIPGWLLDATPGGLRSCFLEEVMKYYIPDKFMPLARRFNNFLHMKEIQFYNPAFRNLSLRTGMDQTFNRNLATARAQFAHRTIRSQSLLHLLSYSKFAARNGMDLALPFLDRDLLCFLMAIPAEMLGWNRVHKALLRQAMTGILPERIRLRRWKGDFTLAYNQGVAQHFSQITELLLTQKMAIKLGYVQEDSLRREFGQLQHRFHRRTSLTAHSVVRLLGLELWLQIFFKNLALS